MSFDVPAAAYDRFMGRYSTALSAQMAELGGVRAGRRVLDVGAGTGALTRELVDRLGAGSVAAIEPSAPFVAALRERLPGVRVEQGAAEALPFGDGEFDAALAQLVVHFMQDPVAGLREMARVTRSGGVVAACVWDHAGNQTPLGAFWRAARALDPDAPDESSLAGGREGHLAALFAAAGLRDVEATLLAVDVEPSSFEDWWEPFLLGVGPAGEYLAGLDAAARERLREAARREREHAPPARAWAARGRA
jgi:SAM-dependent methyltransferase